MRLIDADKLIQDGWRLERHGKSGEVLSCMSIADVPTAKETGCKNTEYIDLINRQKAEILELQKRIINWRADMDYRPDEIKSKAIKDFAERLENNLFGCDVTGDRDNVGYISSDVHRIIYDLVKEMTEENEK